MKYRTILLVLTAEFQGQHRPVHHPEMGRGEEYRIERFEFADAEDTVWDAANNAAFEVRKVG